MVIMIDRFSFWPMAITLSSNCWTDRYSRGLQQSSSMNCSSLSSVSSTFLSCSRLSRLMSLLRSLREVLRETYASSISRLISFLAQLLASSLPISRYSEVSPFSISPVYWFISLFVSRQTLLSRKAMICVYERYRPFQHRSSASLTAQQVARWMSRGWSAAMAEHTVAVYSTSLKAQLTIFQASSVLQFFQSSSLCTSTLDSLMSYHSLLSISTYRVASSLRQETDCRASECVNQCSYSRETRSQALGTIILITTLDRQLSTGDSLCSRQGCLGFPLVTALQQDRGFMLSMAEEEMQGWRRVIAWYNTTPRAQMSACISGMQFYSSFQGATQMRVPWGHSGRSIVRRLRAIPKSASLNRPPLKRMLAGLMSWWSRSWPARCTSPLTMSLQSDSSCCSVKSRSSSMPDKEFSHYSMTQQILSLDWISCGYTLMMFGWAGSRDSSIIQFRMLSCSAGVENWAVLTASLLSLPSRTHRQTAPKAPSPSFQSRRMFRLKPSPLSRCTF